MAATGNEYVKLSQLKGTVDAVKDKIDSVEGNIPAVVDNTTSTSTEDALSANQGKILQGQIDNLKNIGRFLAIWNATTGVPTSNPEESPYAYRTGDYFRIGVVGNRIPTGSQYVIGGTNYTTTTDTLTIGDVYYYDGTSWNRQPSSGGGTVQDVQVDGTSVLSGGIANIDLSGKADDSSVVHKSGNETIAGTKSFTNGIATDNINSVGTRVYFGSRVQQLEFQNSNLVKSADVGYGVACAFKTKALMSNTTYTEKLAYRTSTSTGNGKVFNIPTSKADGTYTLATTDDLPTKTSDLTNDSGFITSAEISGKANDSAVVHKTGDETIQGNKTFISNIDVKNPDDEMGSVPAEDRETTITFKDKNGNQEGQFYFCHDTNDLTQLALILNGSQNGIACVFLEKPANGDWCYYPSSNNSMIFGKDNGTAGGVTKQWKRIYSQEIYQNGKRVANSDDLPTSVNGLSGGTISGATKVNGAITTQKWKQETDSSNNLIFTYVG